MRAGSFFKQQRERKNLTHAEIAASIRPDFEPSLFWDFESFDDNDIDGFSLGEFKRYCEILEIQPSVFADFPSSNLSHLSLPLIVKTRREEKNWSIEQLAERIGYYPSVIEALESGDFASAVCLDVLRSVARELDIPFRMLLEKI
jgi:DNA-binding XRE family transcriptional regulator